MHHVSIYNFIPSIFLHCICLHICIITVGLVQHYIDIGTLMLSAGYWTFSIILLTNRGIFFFKKIPFLDAFLPRKFPCFPIFIIRAKSKVEDTGQTCNTCNVYHWHLTRKLFVFITRGKNIYVNRVRLAKTISGKVNQCKLLTFLVNL